MKLVWKVFKGIWTHLTLISVFLVVLTELRNASQIYLPQADGTKVLYTTGNFPPIWLGLLIWAAMFGLSLWAVIRAGKILRENGK